MKDKTCFRNYENPRYIDLFITNSPGSFRNTATVVNSCSDVNKMIVTVYKKIKNLKLKKLFIETIKILT